MQQADPLIRTKLRLPFTRSSLVPRPRLQARITEGLRGPLTLITAPAGFGKTTLVAEFVAGLKLQVERTTPQHSICYVQPATLVAWLSLDKNDNQAGRFLSYVVAALQEADPQVGSKAAQLLSAARQAPPEAVLTSLINDLDTTRREMVLVLDDYQFIHSQAVHDQVAFLLEHCPRTFHLVIATRSDPPLPLARLRARGQAVELRAAELSFTQPEAAQFLNEVMGLRLDAGSVAALAERTEGWIAGLQMASIAMQATPASPSQPSMGNQADVRGFIEGFSGTNRYILDYLLEEVLASQPPEIQHFLLFTSILERLTAPLCDAILENREWRIESGKRYIPDSLCSTLDSRSILAYLERANLFLVPLDDERTWYRYHHLFADLLRAQLRISLGEQGIAQLHIRAADWHGENGSILEAIHHASMASDDERLERFIVQNYMELVSRGEQSGLRYWTGKLSKELLTRRPRLCIYEAYSHSWFGELDEADRLLEEAEKRMGTESTAPEAEAMQGLFAYVKSRVAAMRGDTERAIEYCLAARERVPASNLALQLDTRITLGYLYFLNGDYDRAGPILLETVRSGTTAGAVINPVAAACLLARLYANQGLLHQSYETYQSAAQSIPEAGGRHLGSRALVEVGMAEVLYEWNDLETALVHLKRGLDRMPWWGKADDIVLAYITLARIHLAQGNRSEAIEAVDQAIQAIQTSGVFSEARHANENAQVRLWLAQGDFQAANRWAASQSERFSSDDRFRFENELARIAQVRVFIAQNKSHEAIVLSSRLEETARSAGRMGRVIQILLLEALALQELGDPERALLALAECLALAEPEGYARAFLDEGQAMQRLLARWLAHAGSGPLRDYAIHLLSQFEAEPQPAVADHAKVFPAGDRPASPGQVLVEPRALPNEIMLVESLSQRELEVLQLIALGRTNPEIARQLIVAPGTVKAHTASIYRKLDVANRTEAVARARQLGILP